MTNESHFKDLITNDDTDKYLSNYIPHFKINKPYNHTFCLRTIIGFLKISQIRKMMNKKMQNTLAKVLYVAI